MLVGVHSSSPDGETLLAGGRNWRGLLGSKWSVGGLLLLFSGAGRGFNVFGAGFAIQEAALLDGAAGLHAGVVLLVVVGMQQTADSVGSADWAREVWDVFGHGVLAADGARVDAVALSCLLHGIVTAVKVLALLEMLGEVVAAAG